MEDAESERDYGLHHFLPEDRCIIGEGRAGELVEHLQRRLPGSRSVEESS
jgi:hypothetical protein